MDVNAVFSSVKEKKMLEVEECRLCQIAIDSYVTAAVPNQIQIVLFIQVPSSAAWRAKYIGYSILVNLLYQKLLLLYCNSSSEWEGAGKWNERRCTYFQEGAAKWSSMFWRSSKVRGKKMYLFPSHPPCWQLAVSGKEWQEDVFINLWFTCLKIGLRNFSILDTYIAASKLEVRIFLCKII